ncbi:MAG: ribulose-phosphate 3-epimerase [Clostridiales bacterium]|jgi:ribulose-phosphate 3-epimerase|nr:ribulose-phosphate 3-epimerase [Clostridiales bacterium]
MKKKLAPSILSADFTILGEELHSIKVSGADYVHFDVMDGHFVDNISFGLPVIKSIRKASPLIFDVHLMISEPEKYIPAFCSAGADIVSFHLETSGEKTENLISMIHENGKKAAIAISPHTPAKAVLPFIKHVEMVLVMTVCPGFGGQPLIPECLEKVRTIKNFITENGLSADIEVDGGITAENAAVAVEYGANVIVAGSAVFRGDTAKNTERLVSIIHGDKL